MRYHLLYKTPSECNYMKLCTAIVMAFGRCHQITDIVWPHDTWSANSYFYVAGASVGVLYCTTVRPHWAYCSTVQYAQCGRTVLYHLAREVIPSLRSCYCYYRLYQKYWTFHIAILNAQHWTMNISVTSSWPFYTKLFHHLITVNITYDCVSTNQLSRL